MTEWRPVVGWEGLYEVSDTGLVASLPRPARRTRVIIRPSAGTGGYLQVILTSGSIRETAKIHILVGTAFLGPRPDGMHTRHLDGDPQNNRIENLRWGTASQNQQDVIAHGRNFQLNKTHCVRGHELAGANIYIKRDGGRQCRPCQREARMRYYQRSGK